MKYGKKTNILKTKSGSLKLPLFMPDATRAFVKSLSREDLLNIGVGPMVVNTYHLYLQPGIELIKKSARFDESKTRRGGIHKFMNWDAPLLSDSGGYQVFSLIHKNPEMGEITDEEVVFKSPLDGSKHILTPEKSIQIQFDLGVDMMVVLDDVPPNTYPREKIEEAVERTIKWAGRCKIEYNKQIKDRNISEENRPLIFGVIQGGKYADLRKHCAEELIKIGFDGYGFGARHVDSEGNFMGDIVRETANLIPEDALRFALGVGTPEDIVKFVNLGWDMFDCVIPTREGRHGRLIVWKENPSLILPLKKGEKTSPFVKGGLEGDFYETININNEKFREDFSPIDAGCVCELCRNHTRAYLKHLFACGDPLAMRLAAIHNLKFYAELMEKIRK